MVGKVLLYVAGAGLDSLELCLDSERGNWKYGLGSTTLWATALAVLIPILANVGIGRGRSAKWAAALRGNLIECLMQESIDTGSFVELTLETGKSYVGLVVDSGIATAKESDVSILPVFSGYRDGTHELQLTTSYRKAILGASEDDLGQLELDLGGATEGVSKHASEDDGLGQLELVLGKNQIVSARRFDVGIYAGRFERTLP